MRQYHEFNGKDWPTTLGMITGPGAVVFGRMLADAKAGKLPIRAFIIVEDLLVIAILPYSTAEQRINAMTLIQAEYMHPAHFRDINEK